MSFWNSNQQSRSHMAGTSSFPPPLDSDAPPSMNDYEQWSSQDQPSQNSSEVAQQSVNSCYMPASMAPLPWQDPIVYPVPASSPNASSQQHDLSQGLGRSRWEFEAMPSGPPIIERLSQRPATMGYPVVSKSQHTVPQDGGILSTIEQDMNRLGIDPTPKGQDASQNPQDTSIPSGSDIGQQCLQSSDWFSGGWYIHISSPELVVCRPCYEGQIQGSAFQHEFKREETPPSGESIRYCRFGVPRVYRGLFKTALATSSLSPLIEYIKIREAIPNCKGTSGVTAAEGAGIRWFSPKNNSIPNFIVCEACYEDFIFGRPFVAHFEPYGEVQAEDSIWACDYAVPFIRREYQKKSETNDWQGFCNAAALRMRMEACPQSKSVYPGGREWFMPVNGLTGFLICQACYYDYVDGSGEENKWVFGGADISRTYGFSICCSMGQFNISLAMKRAHETKDFSLFWNAAHRVIQEPECASSGMDNARWFTFSSDPENFDICGACIACIIEPFGLGKRFIPKPDIQPGETRICNLNPGTPRASTFLWKVYESCYGENPGALENYAHEYAHIPVCPRDENSKYQTWFGWDDCTICPECHHEFIRGTPLADSMPFKDGVKIDESRLCEMYSPRMRSLYLDACAKSPPDPSQLLAASRERRAVYFQTVPVMRSILADAQRKLNRQVVANALSSTYMLMGGLQAATMPGTNVYGMAGVGYGYSNGLELQGAVYGKKGEEIAAALRSGNGKAVVALLEPIWREVE